jgi:hypothetical protein
MQKRVGFLINVVLLGSLCAGDQAEMPQTEERERLKIEFNRENACFFLEQGLSSSDQNKSLIRAILIGPELYQMLPAELNCFEQNQQFNEMKQNMAMLINTYIETLKTTEESSPECQRVIQGVFDALIFLIAHVRWNMCEIQGDMPRSTLGYYQKVDEALLKTYAVDCTADEHNSYSMYNKGKISLLHPDNAELAPLIQYVQYEELSRCYQLYTSLQAYITHFYRIFGENERTTAFLQNLIQLVENQFQEHSRRFALDQILRFSGNAGIGRLLY